MNYDLAKKLKDAGFPRGLNDSFYECKENPSIWIYKPNLSELIEACGEEFLSLKNTPNGWVATSTRETPAKLSIAHCFKKGLTPEEAVANLWLALNEK